MIKGAGAVGLLGGLKGRIVRSGLRAVSMNVQVKAGNKGYRKMNVPCPPEQLPLCVARWGEVLDLKKSNALN
jgi:hypothetical protein